jgi:flagellar motor switch protein FliN/FliY
MSESQKNGETGQPKQGGLTPEEKNVISQSMNPDATGEKVTVNPMDLPPLEQKPTEGKPDAMGQEMNLKMLLDIPVEIHAEIGHTTASIRDILHLGVGSVVELDRLAGQPADIIVNGVLIGQGDIVVVNETFGIRITKLVGVEERIQSL